MGWGIPFVELGAKFSVGTKRADGGEEALFWDSLLAWTRYDWRHHEQIHGLTIRRPGEYLRPTAVTLCTVEGRRVLGWERGELAILSRLVFGITHSLTSVVPSGEVLALSLYRLIQAWPEDGRYIAAADPYGVEILLDPAPLPGAVVETAEQARAIVWTAAARTAWGESPWRAIRQALAHPHRFDEDEGSQDTMSTLCWLRLAAADVPETYAWLVRPSLEDAWREERLIDGFCVRLARQASKQGQRLCSYRPVDLLGPDGTIESWLWVATLHFFEDNLTARARLPEGDRRD
ncbi:MAG TPA: hypothetical protein VIK99_10245, partial [Thermaerobacter sp.]